ncbi:MAG: hypothetical protein ACR2IK_00470 [Chloroflexota bacterium]
MARLGTLLVAVGLCAIAYGSLWQLGLAPGSRVTLPAPVALERAGVGSGEVSGSVPTTPMAFAGATAVPVAPVVTAMPTPTRAAEPSDAPAPQLVG